MFIQIFILAKSSFFFQRELSLIMKKFFSVYTHFNMAIWKTWHCHLGISIDIDVGIGNDIVIFVCLIIPGVLKRRKAESRGLYICVFLCGPILETTSWKFSISFRAPLRNLIRCQFLAALQTIYCQPANTIKRGHFQIFRAYLFRTYHVPVRFLDRVTKYRSFRYFTKK